ncbi:MAG: DUF4440 domain-containing protein [Thermoplasmata archaeon]
MTESKTGPTDAGVRQILESSIQRFVTELKQSDVQALTDQYTHNAILLPQNAGIIRGKAAINRFFRDWLTSTKIREIEITTTDVRIVGDTAYEVGTYRMVFEEAGSAPVRDEGKFFVVRERGPEGKWLISYDMSGSNQH